MAVEKILKKLTPERIKKEIEAVQNVKLPAELQRWVDEYEKVGERDEFIWKWLYKINKIWVYSPIQARYCDSLAQIKTLCNMFIILLDDISIKKNKKRLLNELLKIPFDKKNIEITKLNKIDRQYIKFTLKIWKHIEKTIKLYPNYKQWKEIFNFDFRQFLNTIYYTYLVCNHPFIVNTTESWLYLSNKMQIIIDFDFDLMCCKPNYELINLENDRRAVLKLQEMGRIDNWITTWQREIKEKDFTSIVFAFAMEKKTITYKNIQNKDANEIISKIKNTHIESYLLKTGWEKCYKELSELSKKSKLINTKEILKKTRYFIFMHLICRNYI
ncbi:MAG: hypothetical protein V1688_02555 [bacterium]